MIGVPTKWTSTKVLSIRFVLKVDGFKDFTDDPFCVYPETVESICKFGGSVGMTRGGVREHGAAFS